MSLYIYIPALVCVLGLAMVLMSDRPPGYPTMKALGHEMFWVGLLVSLFEIYNRYVALGHRG